jgi:hypothetical protein
LVNFVKDMDCTNLCPKIAHGGPSNPKQIRVIGGPNPLRARIGINILTLETWDNHTS